MKKAIKLLILASACAVLCFGLASCSGEHTTHTTHKPGEVVIENEIKATCTAKGSYEEVVYCTVCDEEISRDEIKTDKIPHTPLEPVKENESEPTCVFDGGYDMVSYCSVCDATVEKEHTSIQRLAHQYIGEGCSVCNGLKSTKGLKFELNSDKKGYTLVGIGTCTSTDIVVSLHNDLPVTAIGYHAFENNKTIETITFGTGNWITEIDIAAFSGCSKITEIVLPNSLTDMGINCFMNCRSLRKVTFGNSLTYISSSAFSGCRYLSEIVFSNSISAIGGSAFERCWSLKRIELPVNAVSIGSGAFNNCYNLEEVVIKNNIKDIQANAFAECRKLKTVTLGSSLKSLFSSTFLNCTSLGGIIIPDEVERLRAKTFDGCTGLKYIVVGKSVTTIESKTFYNCGTPDIYYNGTAEDWTKISIGTENDGRGKIYYYSETEPVDNDGSYWRYVDGVPTAW